FQGPAIEIQIDENQAAPNPNLDRPQGIIGLVEPAGFAKAGRGPQPALGIVNPAVIPAAQYLAMALAIVQEMSCAMAAEIMETAQLAFPIANDENAPAHDLRGDVVPGMGKRGQRSDELPLAGEDRLAFALEDIRAVIPLGRQAEVGGGLEPQVHGQILRRPGSVAK